MNSDKKPLPRYLSTSEMWDAFYEEMTPRMEEWTERVLVWDDYPAKPAYEALADFFNKVILPSMKSIQERREK